MTSINTEWVKTDFNIVRAGHAELVVGDLARARAFYVDALGFVVSEETPDALYLRGYEERLHHSLALRRSPMPCVSHLGFRVWAEDDLDKLAGMFGAQGCPMCWLNQAEPGQGRALRVQDPLGFPVEFYHAMQAAPRMLQKFERYRGAQV